MQRLRRFWPGYAALLLMALAQGLPAQAQSLQPVPPLQARVTDLTGTLTAAQQGEIEQKLAAFEQRKGAQVALLILPTTAPVGHRTVFDPGGGSLEAGP